MWLIINDKLNDEKLLLSIGKALCLCQKFEITCKDIITWLVVVKSLKEGKFSFLDNKYTSYVDKLIDIFLGRSINLLKERFSREIKKAEIQILKDAKDSRNFIVHNSAQDLISWSFSSSATNKLDLQVFTNHIINVAEGDFLVSKWSYEFHEKEPGAFYNKDRYIKKMVKWILSKEE